MPWQLLSPPWNLSTHSFHSAHKQPVPNLKNKHVSPYKVGAENHLDSDKRSDSFQEWGVSSEFFELSSGQPVAPNEDLWQTRAL